MLFVSSIVSILSKANYASEATFYDPYAGEQFFFPIYELPSWPHLTGLLMAVASLTGLSLQNRGQTNFVLRFISILIGVTGLYLVYLWHPYALLLEILDGGQSKFEVLPSILISAEQGGVFLLTASALSFGAIAFGMFHR